jgi:glycolate oxidase iron-sulfur subunit
MSGGILRIDDDELAACVSCGLCLPHCPTYRTTGDESTSPRGRIAAMREVQSGGTPLADPSFLESMDTCIQCRACETACPSSVPFGHLMEGTRETLAAETRYQPWWRRAGYRVLEHHRLLEALTTVGALLQRSGMLPSRRLGLPTLPLRQEPLRASGGDVWLFPGCVMDAWMRPTHAAAQRVIEATGATVAITPPSGACCGALHIHAGLSKRLPKLAGAVMAAMPGDAPVLVDSAGCGAALKDYGHLLGTDEARAFSARVLDISEWLAAHVDELPVPEARFPVPVAVQDPCHLRHVQRAAHHVRTVLGRFADLVELDDEGMCCGAGGAYAAQQPELSRAIREKKVAAIDRSGAPVVASANPGCAMHLAAVGLDVRHPVEIIDEVLGGAGGR